LLASELKLGGVRVVVVERRAEPDLSLKAGGLGALAGEVLERRGLGPALDAEETAALDAVKAMGSDQRQLLLPLDDNYFCRSDVVLTARAKLRG
jgi:2-polyprenyl-6-methoxyphenol hydroxylase-like FAD-dependent oxidoreductase